MPLGRHARNRYALSSAIFRRLIAIGPSQVRPYCLSMAPKGVPKAVAKPKAKAVAKPKARAKAGVRRERYRYAVAQRVRQNRVPEVLDQLGRLYRNYGGMPRYWASLNWNGDMTKRVAGFLVQECNHQELTFWVMTMLFFLPEHRFFEVIREYNLIMDAVYATMRNGVGHSNISHRGAWAVTPRGAVAGHA